MLKVLNNKIQKYVFIILNNLYDMCKKNDDEGYDKSEVLERIIEILPKTYSDFQKNKDILEDIDREEIINILDTYPIEKLYCIEMRVPIIMFLFSNITKVYNKKLESGELGIEVVDEYMLYSSSILRILKIIEDYIVSKKN